LTCGACPTVDHETGKQYGLDPLTGDWFYTARHAYIYNEFCYDMIFGAANIIDEFI